MLNWKLYVNGVNGADAIFATRDQLINTIISMEEKGWTVDMEAQTFTLWTR
jgi:hypothetical protein